MNAINIIAHSGEEHGTSSESTLHVLQENPIATSLIIGAVIIGIVWAVYRTTKSVNKAAIVALILLFASGVLGFTITPALSAVSIVLGFIGALFMVLTGLKN